MNNQNRRALRRVELTEQERDLDVSDIDTQYFIVEGGRLVLCDRQRFEQWIRDLDVSNNMPDVIYATPGKVWMEKEHKTIHLYKYIRADAARGDEPEQSALSDEDAQESDGYLSPEEITEKATAFLERYSPEETAKHMARWAEARYRLRYSDEERQVVELVRLLRQVRDKEDVDVDLFFAREGSECISVGGYRVHYTILDKPIDWLRSRLQPQPPTKADADRLIKRIEKYMRESIARGDGHAIGLKIDVDDYLKRNGEVGGTMASHIPAPGSKEAQWQRLYQLAHADPRQRKICYWPRTGAVWIGDYRFDSLADAIRYLEDENGD